MAGTPNEHYVFQITIDGPRADIAPYAAQFLAFLTSIQVMDLATVRANLATALQRLEQADTNAFWSDAYRAQVRQQALADITQLQLDYAEVRAIAPVTMTVTEIVDESGTEGATVVITSDGVATLAERGDEPRAASRSKKE